MSAQTMAAGCGDWERILRTLVAQRKVRNFSQQHTAGDAGIKREVLSCLEAGKHEPSVELACRWARGLGLKLIAVPADVAEDRV